MNIMTNTTEQTKTVAEMAAEQGLENTEVRPLGAAGNDICESPVTNMILNGVASEYQFQNEAAPYGYSEEKRSLYENDMAHQRNQEGYPDRTYHGAARRYNGNDRGNSHPRDGYSPRPYTAAPHYIPTRSKRFEVIGVLMRIVDLAGFEFAERVVLRDKETGEILR